MAQHELWMVIAAPLLVLGRPLAVWAWAVPPGRRTLLAALLHLRGIRLPWATVARPLPAWLLHVGIICAWHAPVLFEAAVRSDSIHPLQHITFLGTALLVWWNALAAESRVARATAVIILFTTMVATGLLGALLLFSRSLWYDVYAAPALAYGLDPLADQQLGGVLMWVPGGLAYLIAALAISARWLVPYLSRRVGT
jgi:cytochrome c oxidase assembly factor CtaG